MLSPLFFLPARFVYLACVLPAEIPAKPVGIGRVRKSSRGAEMFFARQAEQGIARDPGINKLCMSCMTVIQHSHQPITEKFVLVSNHVGSLRCYIICFHRFNISK